MRDAIVQGIILISGGAAIALANESHIKWRRWAPIVGIVGQPFWLYVTFKSGQWGMFALSAWYTWSWIKGLRNHWCEEVVMLAGWRYHYCMSRAGLRMMMAIRAVQKCLQRLFTALDKAVQFHTHQMSGRPCRVCGCTAARACVTDGVPCHWVEADLCSACAGRGQGR